MSSNSTSAVKAYFDPDTYTVTYIIADPLSKECAIIDSVLDYDPASGRTNTKSADQVISHIQENGYICKWILETHVHADHITAAPYMKAQLGGRTGIGAGVTVVQEVFSKVYNKFIYIKLV